MKILFFFRFYFEQDFRVYENNLNNEIKYYFLTDGKSSKTRDIRKSFYKGVRNKILFSELTPEDEIEIILRCRFLRNIPREKARVLLHAMGRALSEEIDNINPDLYISHMVDDYVTHLVSFIASRRGRKFLVYYPSYFTGYAQISQGANGEAYDVRTPNEYEADNILQVILNNMYRQNYRQNKNYTFIYHLKAVLKHKIKKVVYFARSIIDQDLQNAHYKSMPYIAARRYLTDYPRQSDFDALWKNKLKNEIKINARPVVYVPLAYFPEAVVDYWVDDVSIINYENKMLNIINLLAKEFIVLVKEHIHMMGSRRRNFYYSLNKKNPNIINVPPLEYSNYVVNVADAIVMGGGSVGVEAAIRGKPIFSFCKNAYWFAHAKAFSLPLDNIEEWSSIIKIGLQTFVPLNEQEKREFILACLRSTIPISSKGTIWPHIGPDDLKEFITSSLI